MADRPGEPDTLAGLVDQLRDDEVVVHQLLGNGDAGLADARLEELAADAGVPVTVALVQRPNDELATDEPNDDLLRLLHDGLGRDGVYLVGTQDDILAVETYGLPLDSTEISLPTYDALDLARASLDEGDSVTTAGQAALALAVLGDPDRRLDADQVADVLASGPFVVVGTYDDEPLPDDGAVADPLTGLVLGVAVGINALALAWRALRARAAPAEQPPSRTDAELRRRAQERVGTLRRELERIPPRQRRRHLTHAEATARLELAEELLASRDRLDLAGAAVVAARGSALLAGTEHRTCFFDPLHRTANGTARVDGAALPACSACRGALGQGEEPSVLRTSRGRPYYETDTVWARTGYGALVEDLEGAVREDRR